jgi:hypothetical protein
MRASGVPDFVNDVTTADASAYATGEQVGGVSSTNLQWAVGGRGGVGRILSVVVTLEVATGVELDLILYNAAFTAGTDQSAFTEEAADKAKSCGIVNLPAAAFKVIGGNFKRATIACDLPYKCTDGANLYGNLIARGAIDLATDVVINIGLGVIKG